MATKSTSKVGNKRVAKKAQPRARVLYTPYAIYAIHKRKKLPFFDLLSFMFELRDLKVRHTPTGVRFTIPAFPGLIYDFDPTTGEISTPEGRWTNY